ncbi:Uma2 family endonuclease [Synechococcus sp. RS9907]|uniref:Uma2 family endonuclease n=1 Tax=Synechococcus sp. RS9907 TaxID=221350 RepID=UPI00165DC2F1|nr:Uma2 family endonuclease [Synechococcus sp. RS9907]
MIATGLALTHASSVSVIQRCHWGPAVITSKSTQESTSPGLSRAAHQASPRHGVRIASVLSPDAALVRLERWLVLAPKQRRSFPPLCPDMVVGLASPSVAADFF